MPGPVPTRPAARWLLAPSLALILAGCAVPTILQPSAAASPAPPLPSATPVPLAATINGEGLALAQFEAEVARFEAAQTAAGIDLATLGDYRSQVLESLIDRALLAQGAEVASLVVTSEQAQVRFDELTDEVGGAEAMAAWLAANGYTVEGLQQALTEEMQAQAMVSEIVNTLGNQAEQVHARHILVATRDQAQDLRDQIAAGEDFDLLARQWTQDLSTRPAGGDLGWFPRGVLLVAEVEQAAFSLPDGTLSEVIESPLGFHLVEPLERGVRPLSPQSLVRLRQLAVEAWLAEQRAASVVEILITP